MINIIGGTYDEFCFEPFWKEKYGSALRACYAINKLAPNVNIHLHTFADKATSAFLDNLPANIKAHPTSIDRTVQFYYDHPLIDPKIYPRPDIINKSLNTLSIDGDNVLYFGLIEGSASVNGNKVVYDPQSPIAPISFSQTNSTAKELAYVINKREAELLSGTSKIEDIKKFFP